MATPTLKITKPATTDVAVKTTAAPKATKVAPKAPPAPKPVVVEAAAPVVSGPMLNKKDYIDRVVAKSGLKKKDVKPAVEAALQVLADALMAKEEVNLPPLGKIKVNREKTVPNGTLMTLRLRVPGPQTEKPGAAPLAEDGEEG